VGGSQLIALRRAKRLRRSIVLNAPVRRIDHGRGGVKVRTPRGNWRGKRVIVTVPPALAGRIIYRPILPPGRDQLTQRMPMGSVIKCMVVYDEPFWRADGLSGMATSDTGPVKLSFDNTPPDGSPGVLLGFIEGQEARDLFDAPRAERREGVISSFERYFGAEARTGAGRYIEKSWAKEEWSRGCYVGLPTPGASRRVSRGDPRTGRPDPLGGYRDRHGLERLHGRRDRVGSARRRRGPGRTLSRRREPHAAT
jgi:monoamine oxidase